MPTTDYDFAAESDRLDFPDVTAGGVTLNRATARPEPERSIPPEFERTREAHRAGIVRTTLAADGPVIELDRPISGSFVASRRGTYLDLYLGVAQRLFDATRLLPQLAPIIHSDLLLRREINTDDYLSLAPDGIRLPQDLARVVVDEADRALPRPGGHRVFFSNSGTEAVEAALKTAVLAGYRRLLERFGPETWTAVCRELGIEREPFFGDDDPVWKDYPLFVIALERAFHGRTLGSLSLTMSRPKQRQGFPQLCWVRHVDPEVPDRTPELIDPTPLPEVLDEPGRLAQVVTAGKIPCDLLAGAIYEPFQGEGGYRFPNPGVIEDLGNACDRFGGLLIADEVQTFARTGSTFLSTTQPVRPDIICLAKSAVLGITIVPADITSGFPSGWHSNTFGSGKLFDVNYSFAVWDTWLDGREPAFRGLSFADNETLKGSYLGEKLDGLAARHPETVSDPEGQGCMWGFTTADRDAFVSEAWRQGAKLLGAGLASKPGRVRLLFPADVLTREIDLSLEVLERTATALEEGR